MNLFLRIDINIVAIVMLLIILFVAYRCLDKQDKLNEFFLNISIIIVFELVFETLTCVVNGMPDKNLRPFCIFVHMCLFVTAPFLTYMWYWFVRFWTSGNEARPKTIKIMLFAPVVLNFIITILSPAYGFVFYIDELNQYHRGNLFLLCSSITYFYIILSFIVILKQKNKMLAEEYVPFLLFGILPLLGGLVQTLFYSALLMWSSTAFSLVLMYSFLQQRMIRLDRLSGAWTRDSFDYYISRRIKLKKDKHFGVVFADIDGLKDINDKFGHLEGDFAIKTAITIVKNALRKTDVVARFGGDEFIIIIDCTSKQELDKAIERMEACFAEYNKTSTKPYVIECSFGADMFDVRLNSFEQFLLHADSLMYLNKKQKKMS